MKSERLLQWLTLLSAMLPKDLSHIAIQATGYGNDSRQNGPFGPVTFRIIWRSISAPPSDRYYS
jgi:hypothetical protein